MVLRDPLDFDTTRQSVFDGVAGGLAERYPIENDQYKLDLSDVGYVGKDKFSLKDQKKAILSRSELGRSIRGTVKLIDKKTNKPVDAKKITLAKVPYMTQRGTFILGGSEYTVAQQMRLRPGVYTRVKDNGELEAHFNVVKGGPSFRVFMDSDSGVFKMQIGQAKLPLYPILQAAGVSESDIRKQWGPELVAANIAKSRGSNIVSKAWARLAQARAKKDVGQPVAKDFRDVFSAMELDPQVTMHTLGHPYSRATPDTILRATQKLININKGEEDTDDRDSLMYQTTWSVDDLLKERIARDSGRVLAQQLWKATMRKNLSGMPSQLHTNQLESVFYKSGLGQPLEEINTLDAMDQVLRITRLGEGGIPSKDSIPDEARSVQPSHFGYIDPIKTAESTSIGVDTRMAAGARKGDDNQLYTKVLDIKSGKVATVPPSVLIDSTVSFPGELESAIAEKRKYVKAMRSGKMEYVKRGEVDYEMPTANSMFTETSNMTPLTAGIKGGRLLMGAKFITQALPLRDAEVPLVQPSDQKGTTSMYRKMGKYLGNTESDMAGQVTAVTSDEVTVTGRDGKSRSYDLYDRFPLNRKTLMHSTPRVKPGDIVSPGQLLASTNFTAANGEAAIGKNLRTAYVPLRGLNYEDAVAISESAAQKMTSEHMYTAKIDVDNMSQVDRNKFTGTFPVKFTKDQFKKIGTNGVVRVGQIVNEGDPLILATTTKSPKGAGMLHRGGDYATSDASVIWEHETPGIITDTWTEKDGVKVAVQTFSPAQKGDKLAGFYGDKGVISRVIPDDEMPTDEEGNPIEVALNPQGIITRTNPAQIVETVLGKIAAKTGKPYVIPGFSGKNLIEFAIKEMEANGVKDTENLTDPLTGRTIPNVLVGRRYMMKLHHTAEAKLSDRSMGSYSMEGAPAYSDEEGNPKRVGMGEMQSLISHGAINNIRDIKSIKGQRNDDYWRAMSLGYEPPTPDVPSAYKKFLTLLQASGVNVNRKGDYLHLTAMTDKDVDALSSGEIKEPATVKWVQEYKRGAFGDKSMEPVKGGLFDRGITGGHGGNRFSHIKLSEPVPNPVMEDPIRRLLGMTVKQYEDVIAGDNVIPGFGSGGKAIKNALAHINVKKSIADLRQQVKSSTSASARDDAIKKLGYLTAMDKNDVNPSDLVISKVPVLPPIFRPITSTSKFDLVAGPNLLYADLMNADSQLKAASSVLEGQPVSDARRNVYRALKAAVGLGDPIKPKHVQQNVKGVLASVFGPNSPKTGMFQRRLLGTSVDMAGRSVITPNPALNIDQVGIPEGSAWKLYGPFVVRRMVQAMGGDRDAKVRAITLVANRSDAARKILEKEMSSRPVLYTRAPALHRYSLMAAIPVIARGNTMELSPATTPGFGADFDGDRIIGKALFLVKTADFYRHNNNRNKTLTSRWVRVNLSSMKTNNTSIPTYDASTHTLVVVDLEDFPRGELDRVIDGAKGPIEFYHVPAGVYVVAHDNVTNKLEWVQAAYWSKHAQRDTEIVNLCNKAQIITDDDPRAVYGVPSDTVELSRATPTDAERRKFAVPYAKNMPEVHDNLAVASVPFVGWPTDDTMPLNADTGYWLGAMAGDGWWRHTASATIKDGSSWAWQWHIADLKGYNAARVSAFITKYFGGADIAWDRREQLAASDSTRYGDTVKYTASSVKYGKPICNFLSEHLGGDRDGSTSGSGNKRLPAFAFTAPREFRESMLCGLIDTDGTVCVSNGKTKPQLMISFTSTSLRLCRDVRLLCRTLGISATLGFSKTTTTGNAAWLLTLSTVDCKRNPFLSKLESPWKREAFNTTAVDTSSSAAVAQDMIPFPVPVADTLMSEMGAVRVPTKGTVPPCVYEQLRERMTIFTSCCGYKKRNIITRALATKLVAAVTAVMAEHTVDRDAAVRYLRSIKSDTVFSSNDARIVRAAISAVAPKWGDAAVYAAGAKIRVNINSAARKQRISQATAAATLEWLLTTSVATNLYTPHVQQWLSWIAEASVCWTAIDSVEKTGVLEDGYDLTVPGYETFMDEQGIILSNTMNFHVVVSDKAVKEAKEKLLPSRSLRSASNFEPLWAPRQEFLQGLYAASTARSGKKMVPKMKSANDIIQAYKRGEVDVEDVVSLD